MAKKADESLTVATRSALVAELSEGRLDVILVFDNGAPVTGPHSVLGRDRAVLVVAPEHPLAHADPLTLEDVLSHDFLVAEAGRTSAMLLDRFGRDASRHLPVGMVTGSLAALLRLLSHGLGIAVLPYTTAAASLRSGDLVALDLPGALPDVHLPARWNPATDRVKPALRTLLRLARQHAPEPPEPARANGPSSLSAS